MKTSYFKYYTGDMGVAICIYPPIDWSGLRFPALYPERSSFFAIKNGSITQEEYEILYRNQVLSKLNPYEIYNMFKNNVLLCWESSEKFCHRRIVADWLHEKLGVIVEEWAPENEKIENIKKTKNIKSLF